jgi:serine/threonine protein kinase
MIKDFHSLGYVHGDIKPNNILLQSKAMAINYLEKFETERIALIDYGLSEKYEDNS